MLLERKALLTRVEGALKRHPVVVLLGPRQCGKSTLARQLATRRKAHLFDLETATGMTALQNPELALGELKGLVVIDEVQRRPELFAALRPLADRPEGDARFLLLGSASLDLVRGVSESLAGRAHFIEMHGFTPAEVGLKNARRLWLRGGYPRAWLPHRIEDSLEWRDDFMRSVRERDLPLLGIRIAPEALRRFWLLVAHSHGQLWNASELARAMGVTQPVIQRYADVLSGVYMLRQLPPWFENLAKRQLKAPKVYVRDSGLLHALLQVRTLDELFSRPQLGASWEGFALEAVVTSSRAPQAHYWRTQAGAELDLLLELNGRRWGFEFKVADAPAMTKSLHVALADLKLDRAMLIYPGTRRYRVHERVEAVPLGEALAELAG